MQARRFAISALCDANCRHAELLNDTTKTAGVSKRQERKARSSIHF